MHANRSHGAGTRAASFDPGAGARVEVAGTTVVVGKRSLLEREGFTVSETLAAHDSEARATGRASTLVCWDGGARGVLVAADQPRESWEATGATTLHIACRGTLAWPFTYNSVALSLAVAGALTRCSPPSRWLPAVCWRSSTPQESSKSRSERSSRSAVLNVPNGCEPELRRCRSWQGSNRGLPAL